MAKALFKTNRGRGFTAGVFHLGFFGGKRGSFKRQVIDGDTIGVATDGNFSIRFLGIDTPEKSLYWPETDSFAQTDDERFVALLSDPFGSDQAPIENFSAALRDHLLSKASPEAAANHHELGTQAERALENLIIADANELDQSEDEFEFFLAFAYEAIDGFARLLCYVHPSQPDAPASERKPSYNERMLTNGAAAPYFIFPNVDPFRSRGSVIDAAAAAVSPQNILQNAPRLRDARAAVRAAREAGEGIFGATPPLGFEPFELRFLTRRSAPSRWLIDLSGDEKVLRHPQTYFAIPNVEDRLFIPAEFVPLFELSGWAVDAPPSDLVG